MYERIARVMWRSQIYSWNPVQFRCVTAAVINCAYIYQSRDPLNEMKSPGSWDVLTEFFCVSYVNSGMVRRSSKDGRGVQRIKSPSNVREMNSPFDRLTND